MNFKNFIGTARLGRWILFQDPGSWLVRVYDVVEGARLDDGDRDFPRFTIDQGAAGEALYDAEAGLFLPVLFVGVER